MADRLVGNYLSWNLSFEGFLSAGSSLVVFDPISSPIELVVTSSLMEHYHQVIWQLSS